MLSKQPTFDLILAQRLAICALNAYDTADKIKIRGDDLCYSAPLDLQAVVEKLPDATILSFRGTRSLKNWRVDINALPCPPGIHMGFDDAYEALRPKILAALPRTSVGDIDRSKPFYIDGHSLGGALAARAADDLGCDACYTFNAPRIYTHDYIKGNWRRLNALNVWRVVEHEDCISHLPGLLVGYRHFGGLALISSLGDLEINPPWTRQLRGHAKGITADVFRIFHGELPQWVLVKDHSMALCLSELRSLLPAA